MSDSSGRVDVEEYAEIFARLKEGGAAAASTTAKAGKVKLGGATGSSAHTINEDERREFTNHINSVLAGDADIGARLPFDTETMQMFDECRGACSPFCLQLRDSDGLCWPSVALRLLRDAG